MAGDDLARRREKPWYASARRVAETARTRDQGGERPYRSHLRPACQACRKRKSRCKVVDGEHRGCLMCRVHGTHCEFPAPPTKTLPSPQSTDGGPTRRAPEEAGLPPHWDPSQLSVGSVPPRPRFLGQGPSLSISGPLLTRAGGDTRGASQHPQHPSPLLAGLGSPGEEESSHIVGPVVTSDTQILADYLRAGSASNHGAGRLTRPVRHVLPGPNLDTAKSVMFARVRRRPVGQTPNQTVASGKCQTISKIIEPWADELIDTYFRRANTCFPLLDEGSFRDQYRRHAAHISPALLASVYAHALIYWSQPRRAAGRHCPDSRFVWNQATDALYSELQLSPGMSTVVAVLLDVGGRPSTSTIGNGVLLASAVSVAHGLGLHRDPTAWDMTDAEKRIRIHIWWALLVHDKWCSLAYGTPPHIQASFHDVPRPRADGPGHAVFLALVSLSEVLDAFLAHLYDLKTDRRPALEINPEAAISRWEGSLTGDIGVLILDRTDLSAPGASNLLLAYLFVRLLQRRMELDRSTRNKGQRAGTGSLSDSYVHLRQAAHDIVRLVQALRGPQLNDFWLPTASFIFTSTMAFLLRVALETENTAHGLADSISLSLANDLLVALTAHQQNSGWDLGDVCIAQYADIVDELLKATPPPPPPPTNVGQRSSEPSAPLNDYQDFDLSGFPDIEELFPNLWDMFDTNH